LDAKITIADVKTASRMRAPEEKTMGHNTAKLVSNF